MTACDAACAATLITAYCALVTPYRVVFGPAAILSAAAWIVLAVRQRRREDIPDYVPAEWTEEYEQ